MFSLHKISLKKVNCFQFQKVKMNFFSLVCCKISCINKANNFFFFFFLINTLDFDTTNTNKEILMSSSKVSDNTDKVRAYGIVAVV